ncbi:MAG: hypothetical protein IJY61_04215 [Candidatus Gastranaerophilales bacterium]|nr:hypothetical protein [Candidatus Gastranaerophilales bacterium]
MEKTSKTNIFIISLWLVISCITMINHELWRDETQVWCIVRDLGLIDIFKMARVEGHPLLWYLLVLPFAKLGLPVISMQIVSLLLVFSSVVYFTLRSPFTTWFKVLFLFSAGMMYDMSIVARNYCIIPLAIFLLAGFYSERFKHPYIYSILIILLSQTHALMLGLSGILALIFIIEILKEKKNFIPISLVVVNFVSLFFYFLNTTNENMAVVGYDKLPLINFLSEFSTLFFLPLNIIPLVASVALYIVLVILFYTLFKQNKKLCLITFVGIAFIFYVLGSIWFGGILYQKAFVLYFPIIWAYWVLQKEYNLEFKPLKIAIYTFCIFSLIRTPFCLLQDISLNFSGSEQIAEYINRELADEKEFILVGDAFFTSPISAYLKDKKIYSYNIKKYSTFYFFNEKTEPIEIPSNVKYYIIQEDYAVDEKLGYKKIFATDSQNLSTAKQREVFTIYLKEGI